MLARIEKRRTKSEPRRTRACHGTHALPHTRAIEKEKENKEESVGSLGRSREKNIVVVRKREGGGKRAPVGGYRENEARPHVPDGPIDRHGVRQTKREREEQSSTRGQQREERQRQVGPRPQGNRSGPVLTTETTTGASPTRDSHTSRARAASKPPFFLTGLYTVS